MKQISYFTKSQFYMLFNSTNRKTQLPGNLGVGEVTVTT